MVNDMREITIRQIGILHTGFAEKFGIPRQASLADDIPGRLELIGEYRRDGILEGLERYTHLWIIWGFSEKMTSQWKTKVRAPKAGGILKTGVFATRSPDRPNHLALSAVKIERIIPEEYTILFSGADMMDGSPVYDIKPYLPQYDSIPEAAAYFPETAGTKELSVLWPEEITASADPEDVRELTRILSLDPRPGYHDDPDRVYGIRYKGKNIRFLIREDTVYIIEIA